MATGYYKRRDVLKLSGLAGMAAIMHPILTALNYKSEILKRKIPSSNQLLPVVGLGTWQTFDVSLSEGVKNTLSQVLFEMNKLGGCVVDSSPMYGRSESVVGILTQNQNFADDLFYATKVWITGKEAGMRQMNKSFELMKRKQMDLMQIHNLLDWEVHVKTLKEWKEQGKIKYWGITHYTDSSHARLEHIIKTENPDFVQFNYSILSRHAEVSLFKTIRKHNTAVLINRPYESGELFSVVKGISVPKWAEEFDIKSWGQFFLKFILSNQLVNCVIPGTSKPHHMIDNLMAGYGRMPDQKTREKMYAFMKNL
ncbi:aldo/keto reductase [Flavobacteriaceae bacterium GSB9]|nr:aldo/keto reductase [Flavobacteriaceae bacterium GSB9]